MTEEIKAAIAENPKLGLVKLVIDSGAELSAKFGVWIVVAVMGCGFAYFFYLDAQAARLEAKEDRAALIVELKDGREKLTSALRENSENNKRLADTISAWRSQ